MNPDPTLVNSTFGTVLILGSSGSGKTTLTQNIIKSLKNPKPTILVNCTAKNYPQLKKTRVLSLPQLLEDKTSTSIIIEDIIKVKNTDNEMLRTILCQNAHHFYQRTYFISHSIFRTTLYNAQPFSIISYSLRHLPI